MNSALFLVLLSLAPNLVQETGGVRTPVRSGTWRAWLDGPGGDIPFGLDLAREGERLIATIRNGPERIAVARCEERGDELVLHLDPYDSRLVAKVTDKGTGLAGEWERYRGPERWTRMPFHAAFGEAPRFAIEAAAERAPALAGRWSVQFESDENPAVALFETLEGGALAGTFLTTLGDYRFLEGGFDGEQLALSVFDGAHAFLFKARLAEDGTLAGDFYSRDKWHETWTARPDPEAALPDPFGLTRWTGAVPLSKLAFPDLSGARRALDDPAFQSRARVILLFGSWCPNCNDATSFLVELDRRYKDKGLQTLGLAFEFGDEHERNARVLTRYAEHKGVEFPILIAGPADKAEASKAFPLLDRVRAYPTTIFMDGKGEVRAVHTGFSGPATGAEHTRLRQRFEELIEGLLSEKR